jgi:hypothetical protein
MDGGPPTIVLTHRPFWGIKGDKDPKTGEYTPLVINETLQSALSGTSDKAFPSNVALVVSGHMHRFQAMGFSGGRPPPPPPQLIVGTGGVALSKTFPKEHTFKFTFDDSAAAMPLVATGVGFSKFGLLSIDLGERAWTAKLQDIKDNTLAECTSAWASASPSGAVCTLTKSQKNK